MTMVVSPDARPGPARAAGPAAPSRGPAAPAGRAALFTEPACDHNHAKDAGARKAGLPEAQAGRHRRWLRLRRGDDSPGPDRGRRSRRARAHRLRGQLVGQPGQPVLRPDAIPAGVHQRHYRARCDLRRRAEAVRHHRRGRQATSSARRVRVLDLRHRVYRRRPRRGVRRGGGGGRGAGHPGALARLRREQEPRQPAGGRGAAAARDRYRRAGVVHRPGREPGRRVQHRWRAVGCHPRAVPAGHPGTGVHQRRRQIPRRRRRAPGQGDHGGVLQGAAGAGPRAGGALWHPLVRGQLLRHPGDGRHPARLRPGTRRRRPGP